ncbi:MAG: bifunctional diaminohydroxyphosphoribosylaminopyrimidine deaminase/5-amino-6-(5-phosphoribosylamino)uracil reductase RibD [bacterium]
MISYGRHKIKSYYMNMALELAAMGRGMVSPNPMVGCVIVKNGDISGRGFHRCCGKEHAEIHALRQAGRKARGATMFVTLEPCSHHGKTPPCTEEIIKAGIKQVVIAMRDPNPKVNGSGIKKLKSRGIRIQVGEMRDEARLLNESYIKYIKSAMPFVTVKAAMTLDGKIATRSGDSKWITNELSRKYVHELRSSSDAVLVGINTVLRDDPELTARDVRRRSKKGPIRIVVDDKLIIFPKARVLNTKAPVIIATTKMADPRKREILKKKHITVLIVSHKNGKLNMKELFRRLAKVGISSVLVEGGGNINASVIEAGLADKVMFFIAPKIIGGANALTPVEGTGIEKLSRAISVKRLSLRKFGEDVLFEGYLSGI